MLDLGTLKIGIEVDDGSAKEGLENVSNEIEKTDTKSSKLSAIGGKLKTAFKVGAIAAAAAVVKIGKEAFNAYASYEQLKGGVETLFGTASDTVMKNAQKAYKTAGISANQYMEQATSFSASLLQSLGGDTQKAAKVADMAIIDMSDNANKMGTSIESIQNAYQGFAKQNYTMLDNLKLGYGGTKQEMERLLEDAGKLTGKKYDINNLNDVYEAIHAIQVEQGIAGTTAKEASTTIEGSINMAKASWQNFLVALGSGKGIGKSFNELFSSIGTMAKNVLPAIITIIKSLFTAITTSIPKLFKGSGASFIGGLLKDIAAWIPKAIGQLGTMMSKLADSIGSDKNGGMAKAAANLISKLLIGIIKASPKLLKGAFKLVVALSKGLMKAGLQLIKTGALIMANFVKGFVNSHPKLKKAFDTIGKIFKTLIKVALTPIITTFKAVKKAWDVITKLKKKDLKLYLIGGAKAAIDKAKSAWDKVKAKTKNWTLKLLGGAKDAIEKAKKAWDKVHNKTKTLTLNVKQKLSGLSAKVKKLFGLRRGTREIPYDGYQAELHKGERVLTAAEANQYDDVMRKYNNRYDGATSTQTVAAAIDYNQLANTLVSALSGMNMTTAVNVDGRTIAQATAPFMKTAINTLDRRANRKLGVV